MLGTLELGRRLALRRARGLAGKEEPDFSALSGAVFGLLGLLIAFTFSGAAARFEDRRHLVVQEANALGTAYLRLDLVEPEGRAALKEKFRRYVDLRLLAYRSQTLDEFRRELARASEL